MTAIMQKTPWKLVGWLTLITLLGTMFLAVRPVSAASGTVVPPQGQTGTRFHFTATGFEPGERVDSWVTAPDSSTSPRYPSVYADSAGMAIWSWDAPAGVLLGQWTMAARGIRSDVRVSIPFEIVASDPLNVPANVNPTSGAPGATFTFTASGFKPDERVAPWLIQPDGGSRELVEGELTWTFAEENGDFTWVWNSPSDAPGGNWKSVARGIESGLEIVIEFTVAAPPAAPPERSVWPASGGAGTTFAFTAAGFDPGEQVGTWLNDPNGNRLDATPWLIADDKGSVAWNWTVPENVLGGVWQSVAKGLNSRVEVIITFEVIGPNAIPTSPPPSNSVNPTSGAPGATFSFAAEGFKPGEDVFYWPLTPEGVPVADEFTEFTVTASPEGRAEWSWTAPADAMFGQWTMAARGETTRFEVQITFTITAPGPEDPFIGVVPDVGDPGTTFTFLAREFNPEEPVDVWTDGPNGEIIALTRTDELKADRFGSARWTWVVPDDAAAGTWRIVARGRDSGETRFVDLRVVRDAPLLEAAPLYTISPASGAPGTTFTFTAGGFKVDEFVGYWLNAPDRSVVRVDQEIRADSNGQVTWTWTAPLDAQRGGWQMVVRSSQNDDVINDVQYIIDFRIE